MFQRHRSILAAAVLAGSAALVLAGCSSSPSTGGGTTAAGGGGKADLAAAQKLLEPFTSTSAKSVLVDEPLSKPIPAGTSMAFLDVGTPIATIMWDNLQAIQQLTGIQMSRIQTGNDADSINSALNTVVENPPSAVINVAIDPTFFQTQIEQLKQKGVPVVSASIMNGADFGLPPVFNGPEETEASGRALTAAAIDRTNGEATEFVYYHIPEFPFSSVLLKGAQEEMSELCPDCNLRVVEIPLATLGSTAADRVVSDLQSHPETQYFISSVDEVQIGLPAKMQVAGIDSVGGLGQTTSQVNYQQLLDGTQDASLSIDLNLFMWSLVDQALREIEGQKYSFPDPMTVAATLQRITTHDNAPSDTAVGYIAIPDYRDQYAKLWLVK